jgi:putative oxidoreductase
MTALGRISDRLFPDTMRAMLLSLGLLFLRLGAGGMMMTAHGWAKLSKWGEMSATFPDPLGIGSSSISLAMAIFAEFFCSLAVVLGFLTRLAVIPLMTTMLVAAFIIHWEDPWNKKEFALLYFLPFLTLLFTGAGRFSIDYWLLCGKCADRCEATREES